MTAWQLDAFAYSRFGRAAAFVCLFGAIDAHHFVGWQLGHLFAGIGFSACFAEPAINVNLKAATAGEGQQDNRVYAFLFGFRQAIERGRQNVCTK